MSTRSAASTATALIATVGAFVVLRRIKRSFSPKIQSKLKCRCGKVQGEVSAKAEDSLRLYCYCKDCQNYAQFLDRENPLIASCGESHIVQVCKSDVFIHQGQEYLKLARKAPNQGMYRYYASCCNTPIMNTTSFLGFVGVLEDNLDSEKEKYTGQWCYCVEEACKSPVEKELPSFPIGRALWNILRYMPWTKSGPFDYSLEPVLWGEAKKLA
jgi:Family of unknown function (DUF6151)